MARKAGFWSGLIAGLMAALAVLAVGALALVYSGSYNVAATEEHASLTRWAFDTTMRRSVRQRAEDFQRTEAVTEAMLSAGARDYHATCQHCHGGPGARRADWAEAMRPRPPHLAEAAAEWEPGEIFWIVKHGIKMTGMPAFGPSHDDAALRSIVAFVKALPAMTPERYQALGGSASAGHGHGSEGPGSPGGQQRAPAAAAPAVSSPAHAHPPAPAPRSNDRTR
ncbi:cytochrome c [Ramlibacter sp. AN1015]|uniref:c-type cytochrome n=1 Tax=Ramlibacter sp. AN1015 TaxID=3133428 RepID=UPI0030C5C942